MGAKVPLVRLIGKGKNLRNMPLRPEACELLDSRVKYLAHPNKQFEIMDKRKSPTQQKQFIESRPEHGCLFWEIIDGHSITRALIRAIKVLGLNISMYILFDISLPHIV